MVEPYAKGIALTVTVVGLTYLSVVIGERVPKRLALLAAIVGELSLPETPEDHDMLQREDDSWLMDGDVGIERLKSVLDIVDDLPGEEAHAFHTLGGFMMHALGRVPAPTDRFEMQGWRFEVIDMDRNRVDKVLVSASIPTTG